MIGTLLLTVLQSTAAPPSSDVAALKAAFPAFDAVANGTVEFWLARAARQVDSSWAEDDRDFARWLLACHLMTEQGLGAGAEAEVFGAGAGGFTTMRSGSLTLTRDPAAPGTSGPYGSTQYGRQFAVLLRQNRGGARVTDTGVPTFNGRTFPHGWG